MRVSGPDSTASRYGMAAGVVKSLWSLEDLFDAVMGGVSRARRSWTPDSAASRWMT